MENVCGEPFLNRIEIKVINPFVYGRKLRLREVKTTLLSLMEGIIGTSLEIQGLPMPVLFLLVSECQKISCSHH